VKVNGGFHRTSTELVFLYERHKSGLQLKVVRFDDRVDDGRGEASGIR